jgi:ankyrin repeat protein
VLLYYIDGYSQHEVAAFLKVTEPALRKRLQRARDHLRETMMELIRDSLEAHRPSKNESFLRAVQLATTLEEAALEAQVSVLEAALLDGIAVNAAGASGQTLLHWSAVRGNLEAMMLLLRNGADPALLDRLGRTPLRAALDVGQQQSAEMLRRWAAAHPDPSGPEER